MASWKSTIGRDTASAQVTSVDVRDAAGNGGTLTVP
jgi:hypothetical protein